MRSHVLQLAARSAAAAAGSRGLRIGVVAAILAGTWFALEPDPVTAARPGPRLSAARQRVLDTLVRRLRDAKAVIDIRRSGADLDVVLWDHDAAPLGVVDSRELAVIAFRTSLQTLLLYEHDPALAAIPPAQTPARAPEWDCEEVERWKMRSDVRATILATQLSDLSIAPQRGAEDGAPEGQGATPPDPSGRNPAVLQIDLKWAVDRADVADRGTAHVAAVLVPRQPDSESRVAGTELESQEH